MATEGKTKDSAESVASSLRPVAKAIVKAGVVAYDRVKETVAQANAQLSDFVQEARAELAKTRDSEKKPDGASKQRQTAPRGSKQRAGGQRSKRSKR
jgi:hypothetical protein